MILDIVATVANMVLLDRKAIMDTLDLEAFKDAVVSKDEVERKASLVQKVLEGTRVYAEKPDAKERRVREEKPARKVFGVSKD